MRARSLILALLVCPSAVFAQGQDPNVLADGNPPLTVDLATKYMHFMQWALRAPLTLAQEARIKDYLVSSWKSNNMSEIRRTENLLAMRDRIEAMDMKDNPWAAFSTGKEALHFWNANPSMLSAAWGTGLFRSSHTPLLVDTPPLTRQMDDAYEEMGYFMMATVDGRAPIHIDAISRAQLADTLAGAYKKLSQDQKNNFAELPKLWVQLRTAWPTLDDATKASLKTVWKSHFSPPAPTPKAGSKGSKPQAAPSPSHDEPLVRLAKMTWVTDPDVFSKMSAVGTPYTNGW